MNNSTEYWINDAIQHAGERYCVDKETTVMLFWNAFGRWRAGMSAGMTIAIANMDAIAFGAYQGKNDD